MRTITARRVLPGATVAEAERLWLDLRRWPSFVDGFAAVGRLEGDWPQPGTRLVWDSRAGAGRAYRGRVVERVAEYEPGAGLLVRVEDPRLRGTQRVRFAARHGGACEVTLELAYELKDRGLGATLTDVFVVRHAVRDALQRTLTRFAVELHGDRELTS